MRRLILFFIIVLLTSPVIAQNNCDSVFIKAQFNGDLRSYLSHNLKYPLNAQREKKEGLLIVGFKINKFGKIDSVGFESFPHESIVEEVTNALLGISKNWIPTFCKNTPIDFTYYILIDYLIKKGNSESKSEAHKLNEKAETNFKKGKYDKALIFINQAISLNSYRKDYFKLRADIYYHLKDEEKAIKDIENADKLEKIVLIDDFDIVGLGITTTKKRIY